MPRLAPRTQGGARMTGSAWSPPSAHAPTAGRAWTRAGTEAPGSRCAAQFSKTAPRRRGCSSDTRRPPRRATNKYISLHRAPADSQRKPPAERRRGETRDSLPGYRSPRRVGRSDRHASRRQPARRRLKRRFPTWRTSPSSSLAGMSSSPPSSTRSPTRTPPCSIKRLPSLRLSPKCSASRAGT